MCVQVAVKNNFNRFLGRSDRKYSNLQRYSYHAAGGSGYFYGIRYALVRSMPSPFSETRPTCSFLPLQLVSFEGNPKDTFMAGSAVRCDSVGCKRSG